MAWEKRRDQVLAHAPDVAPARSHKDRRRWCKGKVGVEHDWQRREGYDHCKSGKPCRTVPIWPHPRTDDSLSTTMILCTEADVCSRCGKIEYLRHEDWWSKSSCRLHGSNDKDGIPLRSTPRSRYAIHVRGRRALLQPGRTPPGHD